MGKTTDKHFARGYQEALEDIARALFTRESDAADWVINNLQDRELAKNLDTYYYGR